VNKLVAIQEQIRDLLKTHPEQRSEIWGKMYKALCEQEKELMENKE